MRWASVGLWLTCASWSPTSSPVPGAAGNAHPEAKRIELNASETRALTLDIRDPPETEHRFSTRCAPGDWSEFRHGTPTRNKTQKVPLLLELLCATRPRSSQIMSELTQPGACSSDQLLLAPATT